MTETRPRMAIAKVAPDAYRALLGLEGYLQGSPLSAELRALVNLRASQINGCAFCVDMHSHEARQLGMSDEKLFAVPVWREATHFSEAERAALELTEAETRLGEDGVPEDVWQRAAAHFDAERLAALVMAVATINAWNRIGVTTRLIPGSHRSGQG